MTKKKIVYMTYEMMEKRTKKQEEELIGLLKKKKRTCWRGKIMVYCLSVRDCKKLTERLNCEMFYHDAGDKKEILKKFINEKQ